VFLPRKIQRQQLKWIAPLGDFEFYFVFRVQTGAGYFPYGAIFEGFSGAVKKRVTFVSKGIIRRHHGCLSFGGTPGGKSGSGLRGLKTSVEK
jgi:hypothetical protein